MAIYNYTRELKDGAYDIDNPLRPDPLFIEIRNQGTLPEVTGIICDQTNWNIEFENELTSEQETLLDQIVNAHKNNL